MEKAEKAEKAKEAKNGVKNTQKLAKLLGEEHMPQITAAVVKQQQEKERLAAIASSSQTPLNQSVHSQYPSGQGQGHSKTNSLSQSQVGFDDRTPPSASFTSIPPPLQIETPWYLVDDYAPEDIIVDDKGAVRAGTLPALVARLTPHGATGRFFV
jgi:son of sevenless-like protein